MVTGVLFYALAAVLLVAAIGVITARNPVHAALFLVLAFVQSACLWLLIEAEFLAIVLVLVYVGAVMVLFLFVVMMLDINVEELRKGFTRYLPLGAAVALIIVLEIGHVIWFRSQGLQFLTAPQGLPADHSNTKELGAVLSDRDFARAIARIRELGWYAKIQPEKDGIVSSVEKYASLDVPVLIDHMARPDPSRGEDDPNLRKMLELLSRGNFWVMLSLGEKTSKRGPPWDDVIPIARAFIEAAPDRCVWASDWPHPVSVVQPPNDADLLELMYRYAPDEATLEKIMVRNPAKLFGFNS